VVEIRKSDAIFLLAERNISEALLLDIIETRTIKYKDAARLWIFKSYPERNDKQPKEVSIA
jgi:hypothetical protein